MATPFEVMVLRLQELGFFQFLLPFMLAAAIFYGLLRRSQVFGKSEQNVAVNAIVALVAAFMVSAYPVLLGVNIEQGFATFMFQSMVAILVFVIGLLITSMFFGENLPEQIGQRLQGGRGIGIIITIGILIAFSILISSGLVGIILPQFTLTFLQFDETTVLTIVTFILLIGIVGAIVATGSKGEKK